jgi:hypothetical protein
MKMSQHRWLIMAIASFALVSSASEVGVLQTSDPNFGLQAESDEAVSATGGSLAAWRVQAGYATLVYLPQRSWEAVLREASR